MREKLNEEVPLLILVRKTPRDEKNPFTAEEVKEMIETAFTEDDVIVQILADDVEGVYFGRGVGYNVEQFEPPNDIKAISATDIRDKLKNGDNSWKELVHPKTAEWLENYYKDK